MNKPSVKKAHVTKERDLRIHAELWHTSNCLLKAGKLEKEGSAHQFRASLIFRAFCLEAFLNWLGQQLVPHWKYLEQIKTLQKLELLADLVKVEPDYGSHPWQIVKLLFQFRNEVAHGKPVLLTSESYEDLNDFLDGKLGEPVRAQWEKFCTEENAVRAQQDVERIANILYDASGIAKTNKGPIGPFAFGFQIHSATC